MGGGPTYQEIVASISSAVTIAKVLISADRTFDKAELKLKLADLMVELANARTTTAEIQKLMAGVFEDLAEVQKNRNNLRLPLEVGGDLVEAQLEAGNRSPDSH